MLRGDFGRAAPSPGLAEPGLLASECDADAKELL
jgi:hypothetical protein